MTKQDITGELNTMMRLAEKDGFRQKGRTTVQIQSAREGDLWVFHNYQHARYFKSQVYNLRQVKIDTIIMKPSGTDFIERLKIKMRAELLPTNCIKHLKFDHVIYDLLLVSFFKDTALMLNTGREDIEKNILRVDQQKPLNPNDYTAVVRYVSGKKPEVLSFR